MSSLPANFNAHVHPWECSAETIRLAARNPVQAADEVSINGLIVESTFSLSRNQSFVGWAKKGHPIP